LAGRTAVVVVLDVTSVLDVIDILLETTSQLINALWR
jgi:hypothetical protein